MSQESVGILGHVRLEVTGPDGTVTGRAQATNTVVDGGRQLLAQLLAGVATSPTFQITAGIGGDRETSPELTQLYNPDGIPSVTVTEIEPTGGAIRMKAAFPKATKDRQVSEAGLLLNCIVNGQSMTTLYNRARVNPPQLVRSEEVLTMTWTLTFAPKAAQS